MQKKMFVVHTPYHLFLTLSILSKTNSEGVFDDTIVLIIKDSKFNDSLAKQIIVNLKGIEVQIYDGRYGIDNKISNYFNQYALIKKMKRFLKKRKFVVSELYIFCDLQPITQYLAYSLKRTDNSRIIKVEDGMEAYVDYKRKIGMVDKVKELIGKLVVGQSYSIIERMSLYKCNEFYMAIYPEYLSHTINDRYKGRILKVPDRFYIHRIVFKDSIEYLKKLFYEIASQEIIIHFLPHSDVLNELKIQKLNEMALNFSKDFAYVFKYHPRETKYFMKGSSLEINQELSAELIFLTLKELIDENIIAPEQLYIFGDISTALITAKWIIGEKIRVRSLVNVLFPEFAQKFHSAFSNLEIECPETLDL